MTVVESTRDLTVPFASTVTWKTCVTSRFGVVPGPISLKLFTNVSVEAPFVVIVSRVTPVPW